MDFPVRADVFLHAASQKVDELVRWNQQVDPLLEKDAGNG
jgi:hypothetical protein